ncbi:uncharacterized protein [Antedon mediterranea]|uniref:uncharacterized protein n=1 Tax=Antedon mediterranea TaxID=105859 RepID=UPI003AF4F665
MMVTVTHVSDDGEGVAKFPQILSKLEANGVLSEEKLEVYKKLTEKLYKDNLGEFVAEFTQSGSKLVNIFCVDVMSTSPDISQAALQAVGFCIYHEDIIKILSEPDIDILLKALQNVLLKTTDKGTCTRALWCIAKQSFPVSHVKDHLHGLLCSLEHVLVNGEFKSVTVEHEAINAIIKLLESLPNEMHVNTLRWAKLILPSLVHSAVKVRLKALNAFELALPAMVKFSQDLASSVVHILKTSLIAEMNKLFACKHELYVLKIWGYFLTVLGKTLHRGGSLINSMLGIVEQGFKHQLTDVKIATFNAWKILIENFALDPDVIYNQKRIKLLVQPFKVNNAKTEKVAMVKFDVWWFLIKKFGPKAATNFDQVCAPLLQFSLGLGPSNGMYLPVTSGTGNGIKNLLSTPKHKKGSATPATPTLNLSLTGSPGPIHPVFKSIQLKGVEALAHILGKWDPSIGLPMPNFTLEPLKHDIVTSPTLFNKLGHTLLQAATVVCCSLATDVERAQIFHIWYSVVAHLKNLIDNTPRSESSDMLSHFFMCIQGIVKAESLPKSTVLVCFNYFVFVKIGFKSQKLLISMFFTQKSSIPRLLEAVSALPKKALSSSFFTTGAVQLLHGTPALFLIGLLFSDCFIHDLEERFFCIFEALVDCGMTTPVGALGFSQSVFSLVDTAASKISNKEQIWRLWSIVVNPLLNEIEKTNEVNQGDSLEHDFSTMYAALTLPIKHILPNTIPHASQKSLLKTWSELYNAFSRCSALVATAEANHACEELAAKIIKLIDEKILSNISTVDALSQISLVMIQNYDFSAISNENQRLTSPHKRAGLSRRPLGNLTSFMKVLNQVMCSFNKETSTVSDKKANVPPMGAHFVSTITNFLEVLSRLVAHFTLPKHLIALLDKTVKSVAEFYDPSSRKVVWTASQISAVDDKLKKFLVELFTAVQNRIKGQFDNRLLAIMSPILEKTLNHPKRNIKSQAVLFWNSTFGKAKQLDYPKDIKPVLKKVNQKTPLLLPSWSNDGDQVVEETPISQFNDVDHNTQSFVEPDPIIRPFGSPSPHKMHGSFLRKESEKLLNITSPRRKSPARVATASPFATSATKGIRRRLNIEDDRKLKYVTIAPSPKKKLVLTEHQKEVMRERGVVPTMYNDLDQSQDTQLFSNVFSQTQDNTNSSMKEAITGAIDSCMDSNQGTSSKVDDDNIHQHSDCPLLEEAVGPDFFWKNNAMTNTNQQEESSQKKVNFDNAFGEKGSLSNRESNTDNKMNEKNSIEKEKKIEKSEEVMTAVDSEMIDLSSEIVNTPEKNKANSIELNAGLVVSIAETQDILINTQGNEKVVIQLPSHLTPEKKVGENIDDSAFIKKLKSTPVLKILRIAEKDSKTFQSLDVTSSPNVFGSQSEQGSGKKRSLRKTKSMDTVCHGSPTLRRSKSVDDIPDGTCERLSCTQDDLAKLAEKFEFDDIKPLNDDSDIEQSEMKDIQNTNGEIAKTKKYKKSAIKKNDTPVKRVTPVKQSARKRNSKFNKLESIDENAVKSSDKSESNDQVKPAEISLNEPLKVKGKRGRKRKISIDNIEPVENIEKEKVDLVQPETRKRRKKTDSYTSDSNIKETVTIDASIVDKASSTTDDVEAENVSINSCEDMFEGMGCTQETADQNAVTAEEAISNHLPTTTKVMKTYGKEKFLEMKAPVVKNYLDVNVEKPSDFESEDDLTLAEIKQCYLDGDSQESADEEESGNKIKELHVISDAHSSKETENEPPFFQVKENKKQHTLKSIKKRSPESIFSKKALKLAMRSPGKRTPKKSPIKPARTSSGRIVMLPRRLRSQTAPVAARLRSKSGEPTQSRKMSLIKRRCSTPKSLTKSKSVFDGISNEPLLSQEYKIFNIEEQNSKENTLPVISESPEKRIESLNDVETKDSLSAIDLPKTLDLIDSTILDDNIPSNLGVNPVDLLDHKEIESCPENAENENKENIEIKMEEECVTEPVKEKTIETVLNELFEEKESVEQMKSDPIANKEESIQDKDLSINSVLIEDNVTDVEQDDIKRIFEEKDETEDIINSSQSPSQSSEATSRIDVLKQALSQIESPKTSISTNFTKLIPTALSTSPVIPVKFCQQYSSPESSIQKADLPEHAIPGVFSPNVSPSSGILKRQPALSDSPSPRTRRVSFADPIEQLDSDAKDALSEGGKSVNRCLEMNRQLATSPLVTTTPSKVVNVNSRFITTPSSSRKNRLKTVSCGAKRFSKSPNERRRKLRDYSHASPRLIRKGFHVNGLQVSQDSPLTQGSPGSGFDSDHEKDEFDPLKAVFPQLVNCTAPVVKILPKLTSSMWSRGLGQLIRARNIITVGHLSALTPTDLKTLPIRSPKVKTVKNALATFHLQLVAKQERDQSEKIPTNVENLLKNTGTAISEMNQLSQTLKEASPAKAAVTDNEKPSTSSNHGNQNTPNSTDTNAPNRASLKRKLEDTAPKQSPKKCKLIDNLEELTSEFVKEDLSQLSSEQIFRAHQQVSSLMTSIVQALQNKCQSPK